MRSSAVDEDGADASFAGQHETYLNVVGADAVAGAIARCWRRRRRARARVPRQQRPGRAPGARWPCWSSSSSAADAAGVVFSANPVTGARDEVVVNASWGLGESVVGGTVTPDTYVVGRATWRSASTPVADKRAMTVPVPAAPARSPSPAACAPAGASTPRRRAPRRRLAARPRARDGLAGRHRVRLEGADLYLLQCRPITTL